MFWLAGPSLLDPSRVAAQIVSGIGFIGAGLIFVQGDRVKGLTTCCHGVAGHPPSAWPAAPVCRGWRLP